MLHKQTRLDICQQNLDLSDKEGDAFLDRIITDDETWIHHYEPEFKQQRRNSTSSQVYSTSEIILSYH
jgi:hypothetical protein